jgi:hypothetical protein
MRSPIHQARGWLAASAAAVTVAGAAIGVSALGGPALAAAGHHQWAGHVKPDAQAARTAVTKSPVYAVQSLVQEFGTNTIPFCPARSGNPPCDGNGNKGDYGTIDRVPSGFSNGGFGNYAPGTKALTGKWMAIVSGTGDLNQGGGCPSAAVEACTGPYAVFGTGSARGKYNVFPRRGFTVTDDLYLSPTTAGKAGALVDDDVEINNNAGKYGIDNIITACPQKITASTFGYVISFGHNSPGSCAGTAAVTKDGWYRFVFAFANERGRAYLTERVLSEATGKQIAASGRRPVGGGATAEPISQWGGPGYFWLPTENISGLPLANFALQLGVYGAGHKP